MDTFGAMTFPATTSSQAPCLVRTEDDRFPDFSLNFGQATEQFELTEAHKAGRRRGQGYREERSPDLAYLGDPEDFLEAALEATPDVIAKKARKKYRPKPNLLVLVSIPGFQDFPIPKAELTKIAPPWHDEFVSIWLLWGSYAYRIWLAPTLTLVVPTAVHGIV